jgi:glucose/arabinose dehydrogenase
MRFGAVRLTAIVSAALVLVAGCGDDSTADRGQAEITVPDGFEVRVVADGFNGPTQITVTNDGRLVVAELNGGEAAGTGRVVAFDPDTPEERMVLVDGLTTPTGVTVEGELLWIMERRRLTVGPLDDPTTRTVVADDLPFNGRSEGTLTVRSGGAVLYNTSGGEAGDALDPGSGVLWRIDDPTMEPVAVATGVKHAYALVEHPDGRLFVTEIADRRLDGRPPPDEVMVVNDGDDFGYPRCVGDRTPVAELGAAAADCADSPPSHALFEPGATPTSVAVAPWDDATLLVALWNAGVVVSVPATAGSTPHTGDAFLTGIEHPQHLLSVDGQLLVVDHGGGRILAIST